MVGGHGRRHSRRAPDARRPAGGRGVHLRVAGGVVPGLRAALSRARGGRPRDPAALLRSAVAGRPPPGRRGPPPPGGAVYTAPPGPGPASPPPPARPPPP